jgi:hypothetical protein
VLVWGTRDRRFESSHPDNRSLVYEMNQTFYLAASQTLSLNETVNKKNDS